MLKHGVFFLFLINCWSSVVASVVLPQLCNLHCFFFFLKTWLYLCSHPRVCLHFFFSNLVGLSLLDIDDP